MKKKVGLITFHKSLNYGSALQTWALSYILKSLNNDVKIIDYTPKNYNDLYSLFWMPTSIRNINGNIMHLFWLPFLLRRKNSFYTFRNKFLPMSEKQYTTNDDISDFTNNIDVMICGSDQIWNPIAKDFDMNYLLYNINCKRKVSYAVSIGNSRLEDSDQTDEIKKGLMDYDNISMREESAAENVRALLDGHKEVEVVLDPTLLLRKNDFNQITYGKRIKEPYIFFYSVWYDASAINAVNEISKKYGLPVYTLMSGRGNSLLLKNFKRIHFPNIDAGPSGFLSMIRNAEYVVTDSFHGTAFSIVFEKNFVTINDRKADGSLKNDERINNILEKLDLSSNYIPSENVTSFNLEQDLDYKSITKERLKLAKHSIDYLKRALELEK